MLNRNIRIAYILAFAKHTWFWLGIWVFFYLRFTNYAGIGILESILIVTMTLAEIPTGALADLWGRKRALILAFALEAAGALLFAAADRFAFLAIGVFVMCLGGAFYSGTIDALVFDTLKSESKETEFSKIMANINSIALVTISVCSMLGGFLYQLNPRLPFYANAGGFLIGLIAAIFLIEPLGKPLGFSLREYLQQNTAGIKSLFLNSQISALTLSLLTIGFAGVISSEMLDGFLGYEFGFSAKGLGLLTAAITLVAALAVQAASWLSRSLGEHRLLLWLGITMALSFIFSPLAGVVIGGILLVLRACTQAIFDNQASTIINHHTQSQNRASTISAFNLLKNTPYVLTAYWLGTLADNLSARTIAFYLGISLLGLLGGQWLFRRISRLLFFRNH